MISPLVGLEPCGFFSLNSCKLVDKSDKINTPRENNLVWVANLMKPSHSHCLFLKDCTKINPSQHHYLWRESRAFFVWELSILVINLQIWVTSLETFKNEIRLSKGVSKMESDSDYLKELVERRPDRLVLGTRRVEAVWNIETYRYMHGWQY